MKANANCTYEGRTARFNQPVCYRSRVRRLIGSLLAPPARLHRYRAMSLRALEDTLDKIDDERCA